MTDDLGGFRATYGVELLYTKPPALNKRVLLAALAKRCPGATPLDSNEDSDLLAFVHPDHLVRYADAAVPAQTFIALAATAPRGEAIEAAIQQSWRFKDARTVVEACTASVIVTDVMSSGLPYQERLGLFTNALLAVLEVAPPEAIHWQPSQQIVDPAAFAEAAAESDTDGFFAGPLNVRFFNVSGSGGDLLMDTLGLAALGLPDLQCHFRGLDPSEVAGVLYNTALYIFQNGDVIGDTHTVEGIEPDSKWRCRHEEALTAPARTVIDMDPGDPHAAGKRKRK
jgi:Domain of unknown function (DUF4261)